jgi:hypothetical protein
MGNRAERRRNNGIGARLQLKLEQHDSVESCDVGFTDLAEVWVCGLHNVISSRGGSKASANEMAGAAGTVRQVKRDGQGQWAKGQAVVLPTNTCRAC